METKKEYRLRNKETMEENAKNASNAVWIGVILFILASVALLLLPKAIQKSLEKSPHQKVAFLFRFEFLLRYKK